MYCMWHIGELRIHPYNLRFDNYKSQYRWKVQPCDVVIQHGLKFKIHSVVRILPQ